MLVYQRVEWLLTIPLWIGKKRTWKVWPPATNILSSKPCDDTTNVTRIRAKFHQELPWTTFRLVRLMIESVYGTPSRFFSINSGWWIVMIHVSFIGGHTPLILEGLQWWVHTRKLFYPGHVVFFRNQWCFEHVGSRIVLLLDNFSWNSSAFLWLSMYPLVNIQKKRWNMIEQDHWYSGFTHSKWWIFP